MRSCYLHGLANHEQSSHRASVCQELLTKIPPRCSEKVVPHLPGIIQWDLPAMSDQASELGNFLGNNHKTPR
jgi:hypothetical protein